MYTAFQPPPPQASKQLKDEGNKLVAEGRYDDAVAKYARAKSNVADMAAAGNREAADLARACALNLGMCHLKLECFEACAEECGAVLKGARGGARMPHARDASHTLGVQRAGASSFIYRMHVTTNHLNQHTLAQTTPPI